MTTPSRPGEQQTSFPPTFAASDDLSFVDISINDMFHDYRYGVKRAKPRRSVDFATTGECPTEGDFVGVFEVAADGQPRGQAGDGHAE